MVGRAPSHTLPPFAAALRGGTHMTGYDSTNADASLPLLRIDQHPRAKFRTFHVCDPCLPWDVADFPLEEFLPEEVFD